MAQELWAGKEDYRPRIERFHDAVRAFTSGVSPYEARSRLSIEWLANDMQNLRAIQSDPLVMMPGAERNSPSKALAIKQQNGVGDQRQSKRQARTELGERYKNYAVMFTALLAESADMNHASRMEDQDRAVEELQEVKEAIAGKKKVNLQQVAQQILGDLGIVQQLPKGTLTSDDANNALNNAQSRADATQEKLENAHMTWLSGQLVLYQEGKDIVQQLQSNGLDMAGRFLSEAMSRGATGQGRGF